jgi:hypothetical protein
VRKRGVIVRVRLLGSVWTDTPIVEILGWIVKLASLRGSCLADNIYEVIFLSEHIIYWS